MRLVLTGPVVRRRLAVCLAAFFILFLVLTARLFYLQAIAAEDLQRRAQAQWTSDPVIAPTRGGIYDRNGTALALSATAYTASASPRQVKDAQAFARALAPMLDMEESEIVQKVSDTSKGGVTIKRQLTREAAQQVKTMMLADEESGADDRLLEAIDMVITDGQASISMLQRRIGLALGQIDLCQQKPHVRCITLQIQIAFQIGSQGLDLSTGCMELGQYQVGIRQVGDHLHHLLHDRFCLICPPQNCEQAPLFQQQIRLKTFSVFRPIQLQALPDTRQRLFILLGGNVGFSQPVIILQDDRLRQCLQFRA